MTASLTNASAQASRAEIGAQTESALRAIRTVLATMSGLLIAVLRPESADSSIPQIALTLFAIAVGAIGLNALSTRASRHLLWKALSQFADSLAVVGLVIALDQPLAHQAWVLMIIPMVSATIRLGAVATLLTWVLSSALFLAAAFTSIVGGFEEPTLLIRIPGLLITVAIAVSMLAKWMSEGWEIQNTLTESIVVRERRLATIENTVRALHRLGRQEALEVCATSALDLGFEAATVLYHGVREFAVGSADVIAASPSAIPAEKAVVTAWQRERNGQIFSVAIPEPQSGRTVIAWSETAPTEDQAQALGTLLAHTSTAIENAAMLKSHQRASRHDALTGLLNRRGVDHALEDLHQWSSLAVAYIDVDDLKTINDQFGHAAGDRAIVAIARRLKAAGGPQALVARFGGDEFVVVAPGGTLDVISAMAMTVLDAASQPVALGPLTLQLSVSIGVAAGSTPVELTTLLTRADEAVYRAKSLGKGKLVAVDATGDLRAVTPNETAQIVLN